MHRNMAIGNWIRFLLIALLISPLSSAGMSQRKPPPQLMLWSWFADDDFRPLASPGLGVAYLALSLSFIGQKEVIPRPRSNPVYIPANTYKMAVVRFDYDPETARPAFSPEQRRLAVQMIAEISGLARPDAVQIDFDAPASARTFYRQLISDVRSRLGEDIFLSITALVSWCDSRQSWLSGLPVDEIVPMAFYMGKPTPAIVTMLQRGGQFAFTGCRSSIGIQLPYERLINFRGTDSTVRPHQNQRAYFFSAPRKWSAETVDDARKAFIP